jgi:hypothetical protein
MSKKAKSSLKDDRDRLFENIACVKGVIELTSAALTGDLAEIDSESVQMLLIDASNKLDEVKEILLQGV